MSRPGTAGGPAPTIAGPPPSQAQEPHGTPALFSARRRLLRRDTLSGSAWIVLVAALLSATTAVLLARHLFPFLSVDNDEPLYRLQAQALAHGHLFPPVGSPRGAFTPWLAAVHGGHYVLKYTPVVPALYGLSLLLTGGTSAALAVVAFALVVVTYLLGMEVLGERRTAAMAAVIVALSPLVVVQSALFLPYLPTLVLVELTAFALIRGLRQGRRWLLGGAGLAFGLAAANRPYDATLVVLPLAVWALVTARGRRWWLVRWCAAGLVLPVAGLLAFDAAATGHPLRLPFALLEPDDKLGFGGRKLFPADDPHRFGIAQGWQGVGRHLGLLAEGWSFGGPLLAAAAAFAVVRRRVSGVGLALLAGPAVLSVGYLGFWGVWNAATLWGGIRYVGPFYFMPWVVPLALVGAVGLAELAHRRRVVAVVGLGACAALSGLVLADAISANATFTRHDRRLHGMVTAQGGRPLVLVNSFPPYLGHPSPVMTNPVGLDGRVLWAVSRGGGDFAVVADHPDRVPYLLRISGNYNLTPHFRGYERLERLAIRQGTEVRLRLSARPPHRYRRLQLQLTGEGVQRSYDLDPGRATEATVVVRPNGATALGLGTPHVARVAGRRGAVQFALVADPADGGTTRFADRQQLPTRVSGRDVEVLAPVRQVGMLDSGSPPPLQIMAP